MSAEDIEKDTLPGGRQLPSSLSIARFAAARMQEIRIMKNSLIAQSGTKLAFQTLPKHMRRRAMSHNVKRLPRRLRQIHFNQMKKSGMPTKQKRPSRKYRRRPRNLIEEYTKRSSKYKWLQTHIWHAKRFHMTEKWGYKLPGCPCDKAFRACYRAMAQHCLIQDVSYLNCIEILGDQGLIIEKFRQLWRPDGGLSIGAKAYIDGMREGEITLHEFQNTKTIGRINFFWQPNHLNNAKLWLWVHPAFYQTLKDSVNLCFNDPNIKLSELGSELCRFRLTGPLSNSVLHDAFISVDIDTDDFSPHESFLLQNRDIIKNQCEYWSTIKNVNSTSNISPHTILSLIVADPRFNLPKKRTKSVPEYLDTTFYDNKTIPESPLWDEKSRIKVNNNRITDAEIVKLRGQLLVPGSELKTSRAHIPIILIQRPGNKEENIGLGGGWDIVLPSKWAKTFWIALIMRGARAGGLRETNSILLEMGKPPFLQPDTKAGIKEEVQISKMLTLNFFKKPPNKRTNYNKLNIVSPFLCNWDLLTRNWHDGSVPYNNFVVLKEKNVLRSIEEFIHSKVSLPQYPRNCLIPIKLECVKKGCPSQFAIICLPKLKSDLKGSFMEPVCEDKLQSDRKELKRAHHSLLKRLRKQRKQKPNETDSEKHEEVLADYTKKILALWLPQATNIRHSCAREVIGFVTKGGFSFALGKSTATGFVTSDCLPALKKFKNRVLFRNTSSRQYREVKISVIIE